MIDKNKIIDVLKQCYDPEIPVDLWSLGLIYDIKISESENNKSNAGRYRTKVPFSTSLVFKTLRIFLWSSICSKTFEE